MLPNCNNLVGNRVATTCQIRKLVISLTIHPADVFAAAGHPGKFFDTWSKDRQGDDQLQTIDPEEIGGLLASELHSREADFRNDADLRVAGDLVSALLRKITP